MSFANKEMIQVLPLPDNIKFTSNSQVVSGIKNESHNEAYTPNGNYIITASSYASDNAQPFNIFNSTENKYWQCDFSGNADYNINTNSHPKYVQNPYNEGTPSTYQGGGATTNTWVTTIGGEEGTTQNFVKGEWIQVQIPYRIYLHKYSILTPPYSENSTFPVKMTLVGSNDGKKWDYIDFRNSITDNSPPIASHPLKTFNINSKEKYSYFRLIFSEMSNKIKFVKINQWNLWGVTMNRLNPDAGVNNPEAFSKDDQYTKLNNKLLSDTTYMLIDKRTKPNPTLDECKATCINDGKKCTAFMYGNAFDSKQNQSYSLCYGASSNNSKDFVTPNDMGMTTSDVYIKKHHKESFVSLDRGLELSQSKHTASTMHAEPTQQSSAPSSCHIVNNETMESIIYANMAIMLFTTGVFTYILYSNK